MFKLKEFRKENKLTQSEVAILFDCNQSNIVAIEKEGKNLQPEQMVALINRYGEEHVEKFQIDEPTINNEKKGVPYYDVDFIGGFDLVENDQTTIPAYYIDFPAYNNADEWINITGHSMSPLIEHGDMVAVREIKDWEKYVLLGEIYAIVTDEYRTVKRIRKSNLGKDYYKFVPVNSEYDEQDVPKSIIRNVFQVLGAAKKLF